MPRRASRQRSLKYLASDGTRRGGTPGNRGNRTRRIADRAIPHRSRPAITARQPVHVTLRIAADIGNLRRPHAYRAIRRATIVVARRDDVRIVHVSIQREHLHLLVEAADAAQLGEGMRRFGISAARQLNALAVGERGPRRGNVFPQRYHAEVITGPRQARHALAYVLNNWRHHAVAAPRGWPLDPYSSASAFRDWRELHASGGAWTPPAGYQPLVVREPASWLLRIGWQRSGSIGLADCPGSRRPSH